MIRALDLISVVHPMEREANAGSTGVGQPPDPRRRLSDAGTQVLFLRRTGAWRPSARSSRPVLASARTTFVDLESAVKCAHFPADARRTSSDQPVGRRPADPSTSPPRRASGLSATPAWSAATPPRTSQQRLRALYLHLGLWTLQSWLAMFFAGAAYGKLTQSHELLTLLLHWPEAVGLEVVRVMGAVELVLALGIMTPLISWRGGGRVMGFSAVGMLGLAAFAFALHLSRLELGFAGLNLVLAGFALVVLVGRLRDSRVSL